jgi:hypothetical protein
MPFNLPLTSVRLTASGLTTNTPCPPSGYIGSLQAMPPE